MLKPDQINQNISPEVVWLRNNFERYRQQLAADEIKYFQEKVLPACLAQPGMKAFAYRADEIAKDRKKLLVKQATVVADADYYRSLIAEHLLGSVMVKDNWLGDAVTVKPTAPYDDWIKGADAVLEFAPAETPPLRLAVDFTTESDPAKLWADKFRNNEEDIKNGQPFTLKYYDQTAVLNGEAQIMPRVVIALGRETVEKLKQVKTRAEVDPWVRFAVGEEIRRQLQSASALISDRSRLDYSHRLANLMLAAHEALLSVINQAQIKNQAALAEWLARKIKTPLTDQEAIKQIPDRAFQGLLAVLPS